MDIKIIRKIDKLGREAARKPNTQGFKRCISPNTSPNFSEISVYSAKNSACLVKNPFI